MSTKVTDEEIKQQNDYICGPVRFISFERTDTGFMAKVSFRTSSLPSPSHFDREKYVHSESLEDLAKKISHAIVTYGIE
jgi:hypothetical protein